MVQTISPDDLNEHLAHGPNAVIIDVLGRGQFRKQHLPGAINVPLDEVEDVVPQITAKNQQLIVYCYDEDCGASPKAAQLLESLGYEDVIDLEAGIEGWKAAGYPVEKYSE